MRECLHLEVDCTRVEIDLLSSCLDLHHLSIISVQTCFGSLYEKLCSIKSYIRYINLSIY